MTTDDFIRIYATLKELYPDLSLREAISREFENQFLGALQGSPNCYDDMAEFKAIVEDAIRFHAEGDNMAVQAALHMAQARKRAQRAYGTPMTQRIQRKVDAEHLAVFGR